MSNSPFLNAAKASRQNSVLTEVDTKQSVFTPSALEASPVFAPAVTRPVPALPPMSKEEIDKIGSEAGLKLRTLTGEVMQHQRARDGGIMDDMINDIMKQAKGLDIDSIKKSSGFSKVFKKMLGMKHDAFAHFDSAKDRIDQLVSQMEKEVRKEKDSMIALTNLEKGIAEYALNIDRDLQLLTHTYEKELANFELIPEDETDLRQKSRDLLDVLEMKITDLKGLRLMFTQLGPRVQNMKKTGEILIRVAENIVNMIIPAYAANFMMYIEDIRQRKSLETKNAVYNTFNELVVAGSEASKINQIEAAKLGNKQILEVDTLRKQQQDLIETLEQTAAANRAARAARVEYINDVQQLEENLLQKIKESVK